MRKYIKSELFRTFNRAYYRNIILVISGLCLVYWTMFTGKTEFNNAFIMGTMMLNIPIYLLLMFTDIITGEDVRENTIKNSLSLGLSREKIIVAKLITTIIIAFIAAIIILLIYFVSGSILLTDVKMLSMPIVKVFFVKLASVLPIWIGALALGTFTNVITKSGSLSVFLYLFGIAIFSKVLEIVGFISNIGLFSWIGYNLGMTQTINRILNPNIGGGLSLGQGFKLGLAIGTFYLVLFSLLTLVVFKKKDI